MATIAVVEDEPGLLQFCMRLLTERGYVVQAHKDGQDALDAIEAAFASGQPIPDLIVSDVQMPRLDGISLCRALRRKFGRRRLPLVLVSVLDAEDAILRGFEAGANDYIAKPYRAGVLLAKVALLLKERELLDPDPPSPSPLPSPSPIGSKHDAPTQVAEAWEPVVLKLPAPPFKFDRYEVEEIVGRGGMSTVYRARDLESGSHIALKMLSQQIAQDRVGLARFLREVAVLRQIDSDRIVRALDSGVDKGIYFLAMELVQGVSAKARIAERGPFSPREAAAVGRDVALALGVLAEKGLVHRDVKPSNFIIREDGRATLVDFGLARREDQHDLTETGEAIGTPHFLSPEVIQGGQADPRSDLYALGASLYEILTGKKPYNGRTPFEVFHKAIAGPVADLAQERPELPQLLVEVVQRLLERNPERRLGPAETVADALDMVARAR
jgi:CheY-like chemotaxis protein